MILYPAMGSWQCYNLYPFLDVENCLPKRREEVLFLARLVSAREAARQDPDYERSDLRNQTHTDG